tara:strand:+ start:591 stop:3032 length:2442 start_codon:yes stop_codon:yes gene_type:complete
MAKQRVQVAGLQAPTQVTPTARAVETFVQPVAPSVREEGLSKFLTALSPAIKEFGLQERKAKAKRDLEIQQGIKAQKAAEADLIGRQAQRVGARVANEALSNDPELYFGPEGEKLLTELRAEAVAPLLDKIEDEDIRTAVDRDIAVGNINWFQSKFDPDVNDFKRGATLGDVFSEIRAIESSSLTLDEKKNDIRTLLSRTEATYPNINWSHINQYSSNIIKGNAREQGGGALYTVMQEDGRFNTSDFEEVGLKIANDIEAFETEKAGEIITDSVSQMIAIENRDDLSLQKKQAMISELVTSTLSNNPFVDRQDLFSGMASATQERMFDRETTPMYEVIKGNEEVLANPDLAPTLDNINRLSTSATDSRIAKETKEIETAEKERLEVASVKATNLGITTGVLQFRAGGPVRELFGQVIELPNGKTHTVTKKEAVTEFERQSVIALQEKLDQATASEALGGTPINADAIAQRHLAEDMTNFYNKVGALPTYLGDPLARDVNLLRKAPLSGVADEATINSVTNLLTAYKTTKSLGGNVDAVGVNENDKHRLMALDFFVTNLQMDIPTALSKVQGRLFDYTVGNISVEELSTPDGLFAGDSKFKDIANNGHVRDYIKRGAEYLMAMDGTTREEALAIMSAEAGDDFVVLEDRNGNTRAVEILSNEIRTSSTGVITLQEVINEIDNLPEIRQLATNALGTDAALTIANDYDNPQAVQLIITNSDGTASQSIATLPVSTLKGTLEDVILENIINNLNEQLPTVDLSSSIASLGEDVGDTELTDEQYRRKYPMSSGLRPISVSEGIFGDAARLIEPENMK